MKYYDGQCDRQTGRTTAILNGVLNTPGAILLMHDSNAAKAIEQKYPQMRGRVFSAHNANAPGRGVKAPVIYDHAFAEIIVAGENGRLAEIERLKQRVRHLEAMVNSYRVLHRKHGCDDEPSEEVEDRGQDE